MTSKKETQVHTDRTRSSTRTKCSWWGKKNVYGQQETQNKGPSPNVQKHNWKVPTASDNASGRWVLLLISGYTLDDAMEKDIGKGT